MKEEGLHKVQMLTVFFFSVFIFSGCNDQGVGNSGEKSYAREHIRELITVGTGDYRTDLFGGISDFKVTVNNASGFSMDMVTVEVRYIKEDGDMYKTEMLNFMNVGPGSTLSQVAPSSSRGIKIACRIILVKSVELGI